MKNLRNPLIAVCLAFFLLCACMAGNGFPGTSATPGAEMLPAPQMTSRTQSRISGALQADALFGICRPDTCILYAPEATAQADDADVSAPV